MTVQELHRSFKFGLDKFDSLNYPDFLPEEIDLLLNQAQDAIVKQRYGSNNIKKQSFEETQKRTEDIKNVVVRTTLTPLPYSSDNINVNARFVNLPANHWITVQELTNISYLDCNNNTKTDSAYTKVLQHDDYSKVIDNPFEKPDKSTILRMMSNGKVELLSSTGVTIINYVLTYIKRPVRININLGVTSELSEHLHQEIVNEAISIGLEGIESKRIQTYIPIVNNKEE